ncbi:E3 SUMO-protein ligase ZBED1-like [Lasioglossum baleicum]|uniref:E3 SUMO-protein ligase ZBED1-like n=1 Tax=Lasioglossum baleicum TaxID=434251 RepID=UPI003FCE2609
MWGLRDPDFRFFAQFSTIRRFLNQCIQLSLPGSTDCIVKSQCRRFICSQCKPAIYMFSLPFANGNQQPDKKGKHYIMKSWVWKHCKKSTDGKSAICEICDTELQTYGSTTTLIDHLMKIHSIECPSSRKRQRTEVTRSAEDGSVISIDSPSGSGSGSSTQEDIVLDVDMDTLPTKRARPTITNSNSKSGFIKKERAEIITQAIAKLIAVNRLPYNFVSSCGFQEFMKKLEPNYNCPCGQTILRRLRIMEDEVRNKIENQLAKVSFVALDTDCWTSIAQEGYINVNAHIIDDQWKQQIMTICIEELEERHTAENLADCLQNVAVKFGIEEKIVAITNDSASNIVSAVNRLPNVEFDVTCAAHKIHSAIQNAFQKGDVSCVLAKASKIVSHFRHSVLASKSLETKQEQLNLPKLKLIQSVRTRWNTDLKMSERLVENRSAIINVLADRNITNQRQAQALEMLESEWKVLEVIIELLKPLEFATTILSGGTLSMVNPIVRAIINNHLIPTKDKYCSSLLGDLSGPDSK